MKLLNVNASLINKTLNLKFLILNKILYLEKLCLGLRDLIKFSWPRGGEGANYIDICFMIFILFSVKNCL